MTDQLAESPSPIELEQPAPMSGEIPSSNEVLTERPPQNLDTMLANVPFEHYWGAFDQLTKQQGAPAERARVNHQLHLEKTTIMRSGNATTHNAVEWYLGSGAFNRMDTPLLAVAAETVLSDSKADTRQTLHGISMMQEHALHLAQSGTEDLSSVDDALLRAHESASALEASPGTTPAEKLELAVAVADIEAQVLYSRVLELGDDLSPEETETVRTDLAKITNTMIKKIVQLEQGEAIQTGFLAEAYIIASLRTQFITSNTAHLAHIRHSFTHEDKERIARKGAEKDKSKHQRSSRNVFDAVIERVDGKRELIQIKNKPDDDSYRKPIEVLEVTQSRQQQVQGLKKLYKQNLQFY